ncbi:MAG TPA: sulfotransferase [Lacipirellulaceae bacterium]|jgi:tetratricopeptide (TPR) repeat protein|nr:sulfotransferase [Lacipirellulaceae bacterium]
MAKPRRGNSGASKPAARPAHIVDVPSKRLAAARSLWNEGREADALDLFREAIRQEPNNVRCYVMAARAYAEKFYFDRMEQTFDQLVRHAPRHPGVHHYIGETFGLLKLPNRAIASYEQAANLPGGGPPTWMELASLFERAHRLDEAEELIERTVRSGFDLPLVSLVRGRIQRRQKRLEQAESTFRGLIEKTPDSEWACQAWAEIALMKDAQEDFAGAAQAIENCKQLQRPQEKPYWDASEKLHARLMELNEALDQETIRRWRGAAADLPAHRTALLTGFPRSGTTLLEQVLDSHTDLVSSEERDFIGREVVHAATARRGKTTILEALNEFSIREIQSFRERYFAAMEYLLGEPIGGRMHLDKNPAYNIVIPLILRILPETRLVIALRDPRDVVLSCYLRYLPLNAVSVQFLDAERTAQRYAKDMTAWLRLRDALDVSWCEVRYEDTVADLEKQARRALDMLGLPWQDQVLNYRQRLHGMKHVTSPTYEAVAQPIYTRAVGRWKNYEQLLAPTFEILAPFIREFGYDI